MKRIYALFFAFSLLSLSLSSCASLMGEGEPAAQNDAVPPPDYNPIFIRSIKPYNPNDISKPAVIVSAVDASSPNLIKMKVNFTDNDLYHLSGAIQGNNKKIWCEIIDSINGKARVIKNFTIEEISETDDTKAAIAIVMDHSGSMGDDRASVVQNSIEPLVMNKFSNDMMALIKYDDRIVTESAISASSSQLLTSFKKDGLLGYGGMTAIANGIQAGIDELRKVPNSYSKAIVVFTDGWDNSSTISKSAIIKNARDNRISINSVDFGNNINKDYMKHFSDSTGGVYHHIYRTDEFKLVFDDLYKRIKNHYLISFKPKEYGLHKIKLKLCLPKDSAVTYFTIDNTPDIGSIGTLSINFDFNKASIQKDSEDEIESIFGLMKAYPAMVIELHGHTDSLNSTGDKDYNLKLSQKRADAVKQALVKKGIDASRILTKGFGDTKPIADNTSDEGRHKNRRTEFIILKK